MGLRPRTRAAALACALLLPAAGCYTGYGRATDAVDQLRIGMTEAEVRTLLGEPDDAWTILDGDVSAPLREWTYDYETPWTMNVLPTLFLFTIVFTVPAFVWVLHHNGLGRASLLFGAGGLLLSKEARSFGSGF